MACNMHISCTECEGQFECEWSDVESEEVEERVNPFWIFLCKQFEDERKELL